MLTREDFNFIADNKNGKIDAIKRLRTNSNPIVFELATGKYIVELLRGLAVDSEYARKGAEGLTNYIGAQSAYMLALEAEVEMLQVRLKSADDRLAQATPPPADIVQDFESATIATVVNELNRHEPFAQDRIVQYLHQRYSR